MVSCPLSTATDIVFLLVAPLEYYSWLYSAISGDSFLEIDHTFPVSLSPSQNDVLSFYLNDLSTLTEALMLENVIIR
jgi:hypothetical protein